MTKSLYIAEKPSVAQEFAKALKQNMQRRDGYLESETSVVTGEPLNFHAPLPEDMQNLLT